MTLSPAAPAPEQTPPQPRPTVMRQCTICLRRGPDIGLTSEERQAIAMGQSDLVIPPDAVSKAMVRWHDPQLVAHDLAHLPECGCGQELVPQATTDEYRCEDRERCWARVVEFGDMWPVDDQRPRYDPHRPRQAAAPAAPAPAAPDPAPPDDDPLDFAVPPARDGVGHSGARDTDDPLDWSLE